VAQRDPALAAARELAPLPAHAARPPFATRIAPRLRRAVLVGVPLLYLGVLLVGPLLAVARGALEPGLAAFAHAVTTPLALRALGLTLALAAGAVALNGVLGFVVAWVLVRDRFRGRALLSGLVDLPFAVSPVMVGLMAMLLFGTRGWLRPLVDRLGVEVLFSWPAMLLATTFVSLPLVVRELAPVLEEVGVAEEEAARTLGASRWQTFLRVTLPNVRWGLAYGVALTVARSLGEFGAVLVVSGAIAGRTETATLLVFRALEERKEGDAHAIAVVLAAASVLLLAGMEIAKRRREASRDAHGRSGATA
jgi:sulfate transport system permease protein